MYCFCMCQFDNRQYKKGNDNVASGSLCWQCAVKASVGLFLPHGYRYKIMHMKEDCAVTFCETAMSAF